MDGAPRGGHGSGGRRCALAFSAACLLAFAACRQTDNAVPPLKEPQLTAEQQAEERARDAAWDASQAFEKAARSLTPQQAADLDEEWQRNPADLTTLKNLLIYHGAEERSRGFDRESSVAARRALILWLIANRPEAVLTWQSDPRVYTIDTRVDPVGYEQAKRLWLEKVSSADASPTILDHAATFFERDDPALADELLARAQRLDPEARTLHAVGEPHQWTFRRAIIHAAALAGSDETLRETFRRKLETSQDADLVAAVGARLANEPRAALRDGAKPVERIELGRSYLQRALQLDPQSEHAPSALLTRGIFDRDLRLRERLAGVPPEREYEVIAQLPERERFEYLAWLPMSRYGGAEGVDDAASRAARFDLSKKYAQDALALAARYQDDPGYGTVVYRANMTLGMHALREGDSNAAVRHMLAAAQAPPSPELAGSTPPFGWRLPHYLLQAGEREPVATFYERTAALQPYLRRRLLKDAAAVRAGVMPTGYKASIAGRR